MDSIKSDKSSCLRERKHVSVAVVDNDDLVLPVLCAILKKDPRVEVLWCTSSAKEAILHCCVEANWPDVLLVDMSMSEMNGEELCRKIRKNGSSPSLLAITSFPIEYYASLASDSGAQGIVRKSDISSISEAVINVASGDALRMEEVEVEFDSAIVAHNRIANDNDEGNKPKVLGTEEHDVLRLNSEGYSFEEIARMKKVKSVTIRTHARRAVKKLGAKNLSQAIVKWMSRES
ncbi:response regulator transcription factor [Bifidobacterium sp. UTCIF-39]|uniref:response regulator n=1 Tax=Bifidobacterium sp. UTCIF-39 TaxID=1465359 RepID=UPI00112C0987|nr:response regulator transcription factor [Bifidobacterium sp. UTCIF-39]